MNTVHVNLGSRSYEILVAPGLLAESGSRIQAAGLTGMAAIITDDNVAPHFLEQLEASLLKTGYTSSSHIFPAGEASKSMAVVENLNRELIQAGHNRSSFVIALGGGVTGDLAGFVASIFYRGVPFVQIPTTIVSQVDSAVGGKNRCQRTRGKEPHWSFSPTPARPHRPQTPCSPWRAANLGKDLPRSSNMPLFAMKKCLPI